jgi:hypothetical protein
MRYATNGAVDLALSPEDILMLLRQPMAGQLVRIDRKYEILAGEYRPPSMTVDESMLSGPVRLTVNPGRRARATVVKGTFVGERTRWQRADFPSVKDTSVDDVSGRESSVDLTLEQVASPAQAQRLARIVLKGARSGRVFSLRCNARAMAARPGATVLFKMPRHAPDGVICEVQDWSFVILADGALGVELELRETSAGVYEWLPEYESQFIDAPELGALIHTVAQPALVPPPGVYGAGQTVAITCATAGAAIRYSLSAIPKDETEGNIYAAPVSVSVGQTLYVRAFKASLKPSAPAYGAYT